MNKSYIYAALMICLLAEVPLFAQKAVQWITWEQAMEKMKTEPRKIIVDIYTEGCVPCKNMENTTFQVKDIIEMMNANFYTVKFDAKWKTDMAYQSKNYTYNCNHGGTCLHELAFVLTSGQVSFPSVVFLDEQLNNMSTIHNYKDPTTFELYVTYYAKGYHKKMPWLKFENMMKKGK